jgi:hypothetical protein
MKWQYFLDIWNVPYLVTYTMNAVILIEVGF